MILSNVKLHEALDNGWLVLQPEPLPRLPTRDHPDCPYQTTAVDLHLANEIVWLIDDKPIQIDLRTGGFTRLLDAREHRQITDDQPYPLKPRQFVLGQTIERVALPVSPDGSAPCLAARVEGRSSFARCGLLVHFTAPTIHAGFDGHITLEMCNFGPYPVLLYPRLAICQLIVERVDGVPFRNDSEFQGQSAPGGGAKPHC